MTHLGSFGELQRSLARERAELVAHPIYASLTTIEDVRRFQEHHVFAVWDFMSLLKALQRAVTCVEVPWTPRVDALSARLVNEIVLGEESDEASHGQYTSHFDLYRASMRESGADTSCIDAFVACLRAGTSVDAALERARAPSAARAFVRDTFATIRTDSLPRIAAAFTLGREDVIPDMFVRVVEDLSRAHGGRLAVFRDYLERHIHLDGERHGPMSARLLEHVCGGDATAWEAARAAAADALRSRVRFWTAIVSSKVPVRSAGASAAHAQATPTAP